MKESGYLHWLFPNSGATNSSRFSALPGGNRLPDGSFESINIHGLFWTSAESPASLGAYRHLSYSYSSTAKNYVDKNYGFSVRCIKNCPALSAPVGGVHTTLPTQITWHWFPVEGASGYRWNTTNDFTTSTDIGADTSMTETGLSSGTIYTRYVWASNECTVSIPVSLVQSTAAPPFGNCGDFLTDSRDGNVYPTVQIGNQCWFKKNLNIGTQISPTGEQTNNNIIEKYCYDDNSSNCTEYGGLYQWGESVGYLNGANNVTSWSPEPASYVTGICPAGWHLPSLTDWQILQDSLGGSNEAGNKLKETGYQHWANYCEVASNSSGFRGLPGGKSETGGSFADLTNTGHFQTSFSSSWNPATAEVFGLRCSYSTFIGEETKTTGFSVRCLRDCPPLAPTEATNNATPTQITWNWNPVAVVDGYKWNSVNNYNTAIDLGTATTWTETGLTCNHNYSRFIWSYSSCGPSIPLVLVKSTEFCSGTWNCGQNITDNRDGKSYTTVLIGSQCWLKENLNIGSRIDSSVLFSNNGIIEKYCYKNDINNCNTYGGLYNWNEFMNYTASSNTNPSGRQGICPSGWHAPSDIEYCQMETFLDPTVNCTNPGTTGTNIGGRLKEAGLSHWQSPNTGATNASGFTSLPGGMFFYLPPSYIKFIGLQANSTYLSTSENSGTTAWTHLISSNVETISRSPNNKNNSYSVRCIKD